jgi:hypothetical protein
MCDRDESERTPPDEEPMSSGELPAQPEKEAHVEYTPSPPPPPRRRTIDPRAPLPPVPEGEHVPDETPSPPVELD